MAQPERDRKTDRGASVVEFAILMPVILIFIFLLVQAGLYYHAVNVSQSVAQSTARELRAVAGSNAATPCEITDDPQATAIGIWQQLDPGKSAAQPDTTAEVNAGSCEVTVTVRSRSVNLLPGLFPRLDIVARASGPLEVFKQRGAS